MHRHIGGAGEPWQGTLRPLTARKMEVEQAAMDEANRSAPLGQVFTGQVVTTHFGFVIHDDALEGMVRVNWEKGGSEDWHRTVVGLLATRLLGFPRGLAINLRAYNGVSLAHPGFMKWGWCRLNRAHGEHFIRTTNYSVWSEDVDIRGVHNRQTLDLPSTALYAAQDGL